MTAPHQQRRFSGADISTTAGTFDQTWRVKVRGKDHIFKSNHWKMEIVFTELPLAVGDKVVYNLFYLKSGGSGEIIALFSNESSSYAWVKWDDVGRPESVSLTMIERAKES